MLIIYIFHCVRTQSDMSSGREDEEEREAKEGREGGSQVGR